MPRNPIIYAAVILAALVAFAWLTPRSADASGFESFTGIVDATDADFCFGPGNQGVGFACNSACFAAVDPSYLSMPVTCPGPAAVITFASSPSSVSCASQSMFLVTVSDAKNLAVADDTAVSFTTDLGTVTSSNATTGGLTSVSLLVPPKTSGTARIVATVGNIRGEKSVSVSC
jgi:hypothetical protein